MSDRDAVIGGRYRLVERIGVGGMGSVWKAHDERLNRVVALKLLHPRPGLSDAEAQVAKDRAMREARNTARLHHRHAVPVFDVVEHEGQPCLVMQYLPSRTLEQVLASRGRLPVDEVALVGAEVAGALAAAHEAGIVHRDVKPANILITEDGTAAITDFGISRALGDATLTSAGMLTGTPAYLAPEIARGSEPSFAADVFSLGATLYTALEGDPPFGRDPNSMALLHRVASGDVAPPTRAGALAPLLLRMLADRPDERPTMAEVARTLERLDVAADTAPDRTSVLPPVPPVPPVTQVTPARSTPDATTPEPTAPLPVASPQTAPGPAAYGEGESAPSRRRARVLLVVLALAVALAAVLALQSLRGERAPTTQSGDPRPSTSRSSTSTTQPTTTSPPVTTSSTPAPSTTTQAPPPKPKTPTAETLAQAVTEYYTLMPDNTQKGYSLLTDRFRRDKAGSFESYSSFWGKVSAVEARDVVGLPPRGAEATIRYAMADGRVIVERTAYRLVQEDGVLKIDSTKVLSRQG